MCNIEQNSQMSVYKANKALIRFIVLCMYYDNLIYDAISTVVYERIVAQFPSLFSYLYPASMSSLASAFEAYRSLCLIS